MWPSGSAEPVAELVEGVTKLTRVQYASHGRRADGKSAQNAAGHVQGHPGHPHQDLPTGSTICAPCSTSPRRSSGKRPWRPWRSTPRWPTAWVCSSIKWELEDLSLKYLDPVGYKEIKTQLDPATRRPSGVSGQHPGKASRTGMAGRGHPAAPSMAASSTSTPSTGRCTPRTRRWMRSLTSMPSG